MYKLQIACAIVFMLLGLAICVSQVIDGHWLSALASFLLGGIVAFAWAVGIGTSKDMPVLQALVALALVLGIFAIFMEHPAFDQRRSKAHLDALESFGSMELRCRLMNPTLTALRDEGVLACAMQNNSSQISALVELQKATVFGPTLSLIDSARMAAKKPNADWCSEVYKLAQPICPAIFISMPKASAELLAQ